MTLRRRVVLLVVVLITACAVLFAVLADSIVGSGFDDLVRADGRDRIGRLVAALDSELTTIERSTQRLRTSVEALRFFHGNEPGFGADRLGADARASLGVDATVAVATTGEVHYASGSSEGEVRSALAGPVLRSLPGGPINRSGILALRSGPALVVSHAVTGPDRTNPPVGTLVFVRELTPARVAQLSDRVGSSLSFDTRTAEPTLIPAPLSPTAIRYGTDGAQESTAEFADVESQTALHVVSAPAPELAATENETVRRLVLTLLIGVAGSGVILLAWFDRRLLSRLSRLTGLVRDAGGDGDREPVELEGDDELSELAASTEETLTSLEQARRDLERTNEELVRANELRDDFVSMISHELRTPLTSVRGFATTIARHAEEVPLDSVRSMADRIEHQGRILARMVDDLLTLSTARAGSLGSQPEPLPIGTGLRRALESLPEADHVPVVGDTDAVALIDPEHLRRIVVNYVENAFKYGEEPVRIAVAAAEADIVVAVEDGGEGVPEEFRPQLFERFTQASVGDRRTARGVGLGLSIVAVLAEANGGSAWYEQTPEATRFAVRLPLADRDARREASDEDTPETSSARPGRTGDRSSAASRRSMPDPGRTP